MYLRVLLPDELCNSHSALDWHVSLCHDKKRLARVGKCGGVYRCSVYCPPPQKSFSFGTVGLGPARKLDDGSWENDKTVLLIGLMRNGLCVNYLVMALRLLVQLQSAEPFLRVSIFLLSADHGVGVHPQQPLPPPGPIRTWRQS